MRAMERLIICLFMCGSYSGSYIKKPAFTNTPGGTSSYQGWPWTTGTPVFRLGLSCSPATSVGTPCGGALRASGCWSARNGTMTAQCRAALHGDPGSQAASLLGLSRGPWRPLPERLLWTSDKEVESGVALPTSWPAAQEDTSSWLEATPKSQRVAAPPRSSIVCGRVPALVDSSVPATLHAENRFWSPARTPRGMKGPPPSKDCVVKASNALAEAVPTSQRQMF